MATEIVLSAREWRKINRQNRRYRQQIKRHPEKEILVSGPCNKLKELASKTREEMVKEKSDG